MSVIMFRSGVIDSLWPGVAIWPLRSGSTLNQWVSEWLDLTAFQERLDQAMACYLKAPNHYLNQCWLISNGFFCHAPESNFTGSAQESNPYHILETYMFKIITTPPRNQWVKLLKNICFQARSLEINHWTRNIHCRNIICSNAVNSRHRIDLISWWYSIDVDKDWYTVKSALFQLHLSDLQFNCLLRMHLISETWLYVNK